MKITVSNDKFIPFEKIPEGTVFRDPDDNNIYYIKTASVVDIDTGADEWNCLRLDNYTFDCFDPTYLVYPINNAELIIP